LVRQFGLHDPLLNQLLMGMKIEGNVTLTVALCLCRFILEGYDLGLEQLVEQSQLLLPSKDVLAVESHLVTRD